MDETERKSLIIIKRYKSDVILEMYKETLDGRIERIIQTKAYIGKNGMTSYKKEGDGKTPKGVYKLGIAFGIHDIKLNVNYQRINDNLYWVDDVNSKYYNQLIDITCTNKDWNSAEHLADYKVQYEYSIEIKTNPNNIKGNGSAIFLHCTNNKPTAGCIAVDKDIMIKILKNLSKQTLIYVL